MNRIDDGITTLNKVISKIVVIPNVEMEEKENIDVFESLPLKDDNDLKLVETKLKNNSSYRNQMVRISAFHYYTILL